MEHLATQAEERGILAGLRRLLAALRRMGPNRRIRFTAQGIWITLLTLGVGFAALNTGNNLLYLVLGMMLTLIGVSGLLSERSLQRLTLARRLFRRHRLGDPAIDLLGRLRFLGLQGRQKHVHHAFEQSRIAPVDMKALVEQFALVLPVHEDREQCPVQILTAGHARDLDRAQRGEHLARTDRQTGRPQRPGEMHDVARKPPGVTGRISRGRAGRFARHGRRPRVAHLCPASIRMLISPRIFAASLP